MNQLQTTKIAFQEILSRIIKHSGFQITNKVEIKQNEYQQFWELLLLPENAQLFIIELVKLIDVTEYSKRNKTYNLENLLCTLLTVSMFRKMDFDKENRRKKDLNEAKSQFEHHVIQNKKQQMTNPYSYSLLQNVVLWLDGDENSFITYILGAIVFLHDLYKINKPENIEAHYETLKQHYNLVDTYTKTVRQKNDQFYNVLLDEKYELTETGEYMFCYEFIQKFIKSKNRNVPRIIYDTIMRFFKMIPFIAQDFPDQAEKSVMALLHLTKQFITYYSSDSPDILKQLLHQVEIFRRWPYPVGVMAAELVQIIFQECKFRCSAFRQKLREDMPEVDFFNQNQDNIFQQSQFGQGASNSFQNNNMSLDNNMPKQDGTKSNEKNILQVFTFSDEKLNDASNVLQYCQNIVRYNLSQVYSRVYSPHAVRVYLSSQILAQEYKLQEDKQQSIAALSEDEIFQLYCKLLVILEKCDQLDSVVDIKMIQENAFDEIMKDILKSKQEQTDLMSEMKSIIGDNKQQLIIPEYPLYFLQNVGNKPFFFNFAKMSMIKIDGAVAASAVSGTMIRNFIKQAHDNYMPLHTEPLKLLVVGGDAEINKVCTILGEIYISTPFHLRTIDIRVFIVPSKDCALCQFLAIHDPWYQRYLYLPFMEDILVPKLENIKDEATKIKDQAQNNNNNEKSVLTGQLPLELKSGILNTYIREGNRSYNVRVYKMKIWQAPQPNQGLLGVKQETGINPQLMPDQLIRSTVFFCSNVMFGAAAEFELQKEKQKDDKDKIQKMTLYDYKEKNLCKFQYLNIGMTTESTDMIGNLTADDPFQVQLHSCKINNVYTDFFEGNLPMPHTDWLELSYISYENSKIFDNSLKQKNIFKKHSKEHIQNAFMSLFTNISVTKIKVDEISKKPFTLVVDGIIYQDVVRFKAQSTKLKKAVLQKIQGTPNYVTDISTIKNLNIPIMSFLPFKV